jgi:hypothetical protein
MNKVLGMILLCLAAIPAAAALSPKFKEWGDGPAQWIMTSEEQRAWRKIATDSDAINFNRPLLGASRSFDGHRGQRIPE